MEVNISCTALAADSMSRAPSGAAPTIGSCLSSIISIARQLADFVYRHPYDLLRHVIDDLDLPDFTGKDEVHDALPRLFVGQQPPHNPRGLNLDGGKPPET